MRARELLLLSLWLATLLALRVDGSGAAKRGIVVAGKSQALQRSVPAKKVDKTISPASPSGPSQSEIWSAVALVTGTTVGAGVLALPSTTAASGFLPSTLGLLAAWIFMASTGLLFAEIATNLVKEDGSNKGAGILTMANKLLGRAGALPAGGAYLFIHYALLIAYIAGAGEIITQVFSLPKELGPVLFTAAVGSVLTFGNEKQIDSFNNAWVLAVVVSFCALMSAALPSVSLSNLAHSDFKAVVPAIPTMLVALVYHNVVPTICEQLAYDRASITKAVVLGSGLPLIMFLLWNAAILGITGVSAAGAADPMASLKAGSGGPQFALLVSVFSEAAIITSFTGFVIGLLSFFQDALRPAAEDKDKANAKAKAKAEVSASPKGKIKDETGGASAKPPLGLYAAVLLPPTAVAIIAPDIFQSAIDLAGAYGITILFGVLPVVMAGLQRAQRGGAQQTFLPGGAPALAALLLVVSAVVVGSSARSLLQM